MNVLTDKQKLTLSLELIHRGIPQEKAIEHVNSESMKWICDITYMATGKTLQAIVGPRVDSL